MKLRDQMSREETQMYKYREIRSLAILGLLFFSLSLCGCAEKPLEVKPEELIKESEDLLRTEDYEAAVSNFEEILASEPPDTIKVKAYAGLVLAYAKLDNLDQALDSFESGLAIDSTFVDLQAGAAMVYSALNRDEDALAAAERALALIASGKTLFYGVVITEKDVRTLSAQAYYALGRYSEAQAAVERVLGPSGVDPNNPATWRGYRTYREVVLALIEGLKSG